MPRATSTTRSKPRSGRRGPRGLLVEAAAHVEAVDAALRGRARRAGADRRPAPGSTLLAVELESPAELLPRFEARLDADGAVRSRRARDASTPRWSGPRTRCGPWPGTGSGPAARSRRWPRDASRAAAIEAFTSVQVALSAIDRLEVRGRDSAGLHLFVRDHGLDLESPRSRRCSTRARGGPAVPLRRGARRRTARSCFVYKAAAEIGELGDNVAALRAAITARPAAAPRARQRDRARRRARAHALGERRDHLRGERAPAEPGRGGRGRRGRARTSPPRSTATSTTSPSSSRCTTSRSRRRSRPTRRSSPRSCAAGSTRARSSTEAFRDAVAAFEGSVAIGAHAACRARPGACSRSGAAARRSTSGSPTTASWSRASRTAWSRRPRRYLRLDGETPGNPENPGASRGQIVVLDAGGGRARSTGIERISYDGTPLPVDADELVDRADHDPRHRPRRVPALPAQGDLRGAGVVPQDAAGQDHRARRRAARRAPARDAVRGAAGAAARGSVPPGARRSVRAPRPSRGRASRSRCRTRSARRTVAVEAVLATELSGFRLGADMSDTLVIAISQSGTTTDTNRTVDLARARGAAVLAIVNRRNSDLVDRTDGVLYTSDGRDVEMSVASTKAFYAQVAAGFLLAFALADECSRDRRAPRTGSTAARRSVLRGCASCPTRWSRCSRGARRSASPRSGSRRPGATGPSSATARTGSPRTRCGSSSRSSATSRSPATAPRTRSTSTSRPSR